MCHPRRHAGRTKILGVDCSRVRRVRRVHRVRRGRVEQPRAAQGLPLGVVEEMEPIEEIAVRARMEELKKQFPQTETVLANIGRAEKGETTDVNYMEVLVDVTDIF